MEIYPELIDIGCGPDKIKGSFGIDAIKYEGVDLVTNVTALPFPDNSIKHVYSSHTLEHFSHREADGVLNEWVRVLKPGGKIEIRCPDLRMRCLMFFFHPSYDHIRAIYGSQKDEFNYHKSGFTFGILKQKLEALGIEKIKRIKDWNGMIPYSDLHIVGYKKS